jgi:hypothetical protein
VPARQRRAASGAFCNFPFDAEYRPLYLSLVASLVCTGQTPRTVLEIPPDKDRLERIMQLLGACAYSLHDLSRVEVSTGGLPRFNMPFELGLAAALALRKGSRHQFRLLEARPNRIQRSLSDLNGYEAFIHRGRPDGVFNAVSDIFTQLRPFPIGDLHGFRKVHRALTAFADQQYRRATLYTPDRFSQVVIAATALVGRYRD